MSPGAESYLMKFQKEVNVRKGPVPDACNFSNKQLIQCIKKILGLNTEVSNSSHSLNASTVPPFPCHSGSVILVIGLLD